MSPPASPWPSNRHRSERVVAACNLCKRRKVKCDGHHPCSYCTARDLQDACIFSEARRAEKRTRRIRSSEVPSREQSVSHGNRNQPSRSPRGPNEDTGSSISPAATRNAYGEHMDNRQGAVVPLEGRIVRDAQGKAIFIGDCAPLSFLQTVKQLIKQLVTAEIDSHTLQSQAVRDSMIEAAPAPDSQGHSNRNADVSAEQTDALTQEYLVVTSGLVDLFERQALAEDIRRNLHSAGDPVTKATCLLVLAIGAQNSDESCAQAWSSRAREILLAHMCDAMSVCTVQGFLLLTIYTLRAFQPNAAFLFMSLASRTAYAIGLHRKEVNASYGQTNEASRNRTWKSLRCVDMLISTILGRPPSSSDIDCTVQYNKPELGHDISDQIIDASVQLFIILEKVVVEVYSRKRISLRIAHHISRQLKAWGAMWLQPLASALTTDSAQAVRIGACQILSSYFYGITLLTRPFLIYGVSPDKRSSSHADDTEKRKFADAAVDAAVTFVDMIVERISSGDMPSKMPLIVSWLFSASLVLILGMVGQGGRSVETSCTQSIDCLDFFARVDPHARQHASMTRNLLNVVLKHLESEENRRKERRSQASSQLFGLGVSTPEPLGRSPRHPPNQPPLQDLPPTSAAPSAFDWTTYDTDFSTTPWSQDVDSSLQEFLGPGRQGVEGSWADVSLFPLDEYFTGFLGAEGGDDSVAMPAFSSG